MKSYFHTRSTLLNQHLEQLDSLRAQILLYPLSPKYEYALRWKTQVERIQGILFLHGFAVPKEAVLEFLARPSNRNRAPNEILADKYKLIFDSLAHEWIGNGASVGSKDVLDVLKSFNTRQHVRLKNDPSLLTALLDYVQVTSEHPVVQAGLAYALLFDVLGQKEAYAPAQLLCHMFLFKAGFDVKKLYSLERKFAANRQDFQTVLQDSIELKNLTPWLEYFCQALIQELEHIHKIIASAKVTVSDIHTKINERQRNILGLLERPGSTITNRQIQRLYNISQITASRDLAYLASSGFLLAIGKGRSVRYTLL